MKSPNKVGFLDVPDRVLLYHLVQIDKGRYGNCQFPIRNWRFLVPRKWKLEPLHVKGCSGSWVGTVIIIIFSNLFIYFK